jgi:hypothetical protein
MPAHSPAPEARPLPTGEVRISFLERGQMMVL